MYVFKACACFLTLLVLQVSSSFCTELMIMTFLTKDTLSNSILNFLFHLLSTSLITFITFFYFSRTKIKYIYPVSILLILLSYLFWFFLFSNLNSISTDLRFTVLSIITAIVTMVFAVRVGLKRSANNDAEPML